MMPDIFIFTNGDFKIGFGHISRVLILGKLFKEKGYGVCFVLPVSCSFIDVIAKENETRIVDSFGSKAEVLSVFRYKSKCIAIIDSIEEDYDTLFYLQENNNLFLVSITLFFFDKNKRYENLSFYPNFLMNETLVIENKNHNQLKIYAGKEFFIFRKEFNNLTKHIRKKANKILVSMGGADPNGITLRVLEAVFDFSNKYVVILLDESSKCYNSVYQICEKNNLTLISRANNMAELMLDSDIVILNGGTTRYEACLCCTPFIAISIHNVQYKLTEHLTKVVGGLNLGVIDELNEEEINSSIENLLNNYSLRLDISNKMRGLFDTDGAERISGNIIIEYENFWDDEKNYGRR